MFFAHIVGIVALSVLAIAQQRMACCGELSAYLVGAARQQAALYKRESVLGGEGSVLGGGRLGAFLHFIADVDLILYGVFENVTLKGTAGRGHFSVDNGKIELVYLAVAYLVVENSQSFGSFGGDNDAAGVAVYSVAESGSEGVFLARSPFTLLVQIILNVGNEGVVIVGTRAVAEHAGFLIGQQDMLILVDYVYFGRGYLQVCVLLAGLFEKLVVYVKVENVTLAKTVFPLGAFSVDLYALYSYIFLAERGREQGNRLIEKAIKALTCVIFSYYKFFQFYSSLI